MMSYQGLVGRVLADHVYWDARCVATRNQDISDGLASNLVASLQPIHVRSPLTCKSIVFSGFDLLVALWLESCLL